MQLIDELLPVVPGAPNLGGHNRSGNSIQAILSKQKLHYVTAVQALILYLSVQLIDELLPVVPGAPNLGGHNRSGESMKALKAKQKLQQSQPGSEAGRRAGAVAGALPGNVAQMPSAGLMHNSLAAPREATWEQGPLLVRVRMHTVLD